MTATTARPAPPAAIRRSRSSAAIARDIERDLDSDLVRARHPADRSLVLAVKTWGLVALVADRAWRWCR